MPPIVLKDSNNTIIHLAPSPVVAKVATSTLRKQHVSSLEHELNVALHLASSDAPIVPPSREPPPAVYRDGNLEVTFWHTAPEKSGRKIDHPELIVAVQAFILLSPTTGAASNLSPKKYEECYSLLDSGPSSAELSLADCKFLRQVYGHLCARLQTFDYECGPAHEEIHGGNVLWRDGKPLLIDFRVVALRRAR